VCGVLGDRRAGHSDCIWTVPCQNSEPSTSIESRVAGIRSIQGTYTVFHTESGELLEDTPQPYSQLWVLNDELSREHHLHSSNLSRRPASRRGSEMPLQPTCQLGWVGGPGGRYMLWVPVEWRVAWHCGTWKRARPLSNGHVFTG
jgi:hypothetical protein